MYNNVPDVSSALALAVSFLTFAISVLYPHIEEIVEKSIDDLSKAEKPIRNRKKEIRGALLGSALPFSVASVYLTYLSVWSLMLQGGPWSVTKGVLFLAAAIAAYMSILSINACVRLIGKFHKVFVFGKKYVPRKPKKGEIEHVSHK